MTSTTPVDGTSKSAKKVSGKLNGEDFTSASKFDYSYIFNLLTTATDLCLGNGSYWGSPDARLDDVFIHNRALSISEVSALKKVANRVIDYANPTTGINEIADRQQSAVNCQLYDLQGRKIENRKLVNRQLKRGLYIVGGRKVLVK